MDDSYFKVDGVEINMAVDKSHVEKNVASSMALNIPDVFNTPDWRSRVPIALIGGGPSIKDQLHKIRRYINIMVCGSAHDYIVSKDIFPKWCLVCDPDPIVNNYLTKANRLTKYLVASQCAPETFEYLKNKNVDIIRWHCAGNKEENKIFGEFPILVGGGCTVGSRAIVMAYHFGFDNLHLFGYDGCIIDGISHAYEFSNPEKEKLKKVLDIYVGSVKYTMADYMLAQYFDIKHIVGKLGNEIRLTVHGESVLKQICTKGDTNG